MLSQHRLFLLFFLISEVKGGDGSGGTTLWVLVSNLTLITLAMLLAVVISEGKAFNDTDLFSHSPTFILFYLFFLGLLSNIYFLKVNKGI